MPRRRLLLSAAFAAAALGLAALTAPPAAAQPGPADESFESADGVKLNGRFYKAAAARNGSCVLLLPGYKKDPTKGDWDGLAKRLAGEGYNVLLLHYRGHGKSTDLDAKPFYGDPVLGPVNRAFVTGYGRNPPRGSLQMSELKRDYLPMLVNDVMAARSYLERLNDAGAVNVSTTYLIAAGDAVNIAALYWAAEWKREAQQPNIAVPPSFIAGNRPVFIPPQADAAGKDLAGVVLLSPEKHPALPDNALKALVSRYAPDVRSTRVLFLHGEKDEKGKAQAKYFHDEVLVAKGGKKVDKMELTEIRAVKGSKLSGVDLLGKNDLLGTEDTISKYLKAIEEDRKGKARFERKYTKPLPVHLPSFGIQF
jgi:pimeloyl-ACP methyl ester carboxylesterase